MTRVFFVCDLHAQKRRYETLFDVVAEKKPKAVLFGGDADSCADTVVVCPTLLRAGRGRWLEFRTDQGRRLAGGAGTDPELHRLHRVERPERLAEAVKVARRQREHPPPGVGGGLRPAETVERHFDQALRWLLRFRRG